MWHRQNVSTSRYSAQVPPETVGGRGGIKGCVVVDEAVVVEQFLELARGTVTPLIDFLPAFEEAVTVPGTLTLVRTHFLAHDDFRREHRL